MKYRFFIKTIFLLIGGIFYVSGLASADTSQLISQLVRQLGVTQQQATGGAGAVFKEAKNNMNPGDYSQLLGALPGIDSLIDAAPQASSLGGKASSFLGSSSGSVAGLSTLADSFSQLGLSPDMVSKYVSVIMDFAQSEGGQQTMSLLKGALP